MFSWYKYLIVSLVFPHLGFWSGSLFLIAPFPDLCLLVLFPLQQTSLFKITMWVVQVQKAFPTLYNDLKGGGGMDSVEQFHSTNIKP